jgi:hypothetical protein
MATSKDIMDINPLERMDKLEDINVEKRTSLASKRKELAELEERKKKEIEELERIKKREIDDLDIKKKELKDLEEKKAREIEETEELIEKSFQDLMRHKRMLIKEEEDLGIEKKKSLEENLIGNIPQQNQGVDYGKFFESLKVPDRLYDIANSGFYNSLKDLRERALTGTISPEEEAFVNQLKERFENFQNPGYLGNRDRNEYVTRSLKVIEDIDVSWAYK